MVSSTDSSSSAAASFCSVVDAPADRIVRIELEAAEVLADLAHLAMRESGGRDSGGKWGSKGKRAMKRLKSESPPDDSALKPVVDSVPECWDPVQDQGVVDQQHGETVCGNGEINPDKTVPYADSRNPSANFLGNVSSCGGGRSRQNLTEAEKEARRLRRILANRESARQTIRRRQALCEELTRKAADLTWENESLKREKELALKEYQSLEITNKHLKAQMAKVIKADKEEFIGNRRESCDKMPTSHGVNYPFILYNQHSFAPVCWPSIIRSPHPVQSHHGPQDPIVIPSNVFNSANGKVDSSQQQQETPIDVGRPRTPLYIVPCPWFFPITDHETGLHPQPSFGIKHLQDVASVNNQYNNGSSSLKAASLVENHHSPLSVKVKSEDASSTKVKVINDLNEMPVGFPPDGGGQCLGSRPTELNFVQVPPSSGVPEISVKNETLQSEIFPITDRICTKVTQRVSSLRQHENLLKFPSKKLVDSAAAAEARKRRKELTKLKNVHGRRCRMNC